MLTSPSPVTQASGTFRASVAPRSMRRLAFEELEVRKMLTVPFGATPNDTAEFLLGDVAVSLVFTESNGGIDTNAEDWSTGPIDEVANAKSAIADGLAWWTDLLAAQGSAHSLNFIIDATHADTRFSTQYEPISRQSNDYPLWVAEFLAGQGFDTGDVHQDILTYNHAQRIAHETNWAFTIFVVKADADGRFASNGDFSRAFAFAGGQFLVMPHNRPPSTVAHEVGHIFYALDEFAGSRSYSDTRGYYNTQNLNAFVNNPNTANRVLSIMDAIGAAYDANAASPTSMEMVGWKDTDGDGIFDVLDVPHSISGSGSFDEQSRVYRFVGLSSVRTLDNKNPSGLGNDITLNQISRAQFRIDGGAWQDAATYSATTTAVVDVSTSAIPNGQHTVEIRTVDDATGVVSAVFQAVVGEPVESDWQNPNLAADVDGDGNVSIADLQSLVQDILINSSRVLGSRAVVAAPYYDVDGNGVLNVSDIAPIASFIVSQNFSGGSNSRGASATGEGEPPVDDTVGESVLAAPYFEHTYRITPAVRHGDTNPQKEILAREVSRLPAEPAEIVTPRDTTLRFMPGGSLGIVDLDELLAPIATEISEVWNSFGVGAPPSQLTPPIHRR